MATQVYATSSLGGYFSVPKLSDKLRIQAQPLMKFRQFCEVMDEAGKNKGNTFYWDIISNISTAGSTIAETATIPRTNFIIYQGTGTITEYGNAIEYTQKLKSLSEIPVTDAIEKTLRNDLAKVLEAAVEAQFDTCNIRAVQTASSGVAITTNGTATATSTSNLSKPGVQQIVNYMRATMLAPPYANDDYMAIVTVNSMYGIYTDYEAIVQYTKYPAEGEVGRYYNTRFVMDTASMSNAIGKSALYGEAYFFGAEPVCEGVAIPEEIRVDTPTDFGRLQAIAWYYLGGFKIMHAANPDNRIVKLDSA